MRCCLFGHLPGEITYTGWERPSGYRMDLGARAVIYAEAWCLRCGDRYRFSEQLPPAALPAIDYIVNQYTNDIRNETPKLRDEVAKLAAENHAARTQNDHLRAELAKGR